MPAKKEPTNRSVRVAVAILILLAVAGVTVWYKIYREVPQPNWIATDERANFLYGSVGAERTAGLPYWIWLALPRLFPEYLPGPGGYAALGMSWEEGKEMPVGFSKKTIGCVRVAGNCALCHTASYRVTPDETPTVLPIVPCRTDVQRLFTFFRQCAQDPRFNATEILSEIDMATKLSCMDRLLYRFIWIPRTRNLLSQGFLITDATLRRHSRDPSAELSGERMRALVVWLKNVKSPAYPLPVVAVLAASGQAVFKQHCGSCHGDGTDRWTGKVIPINEIDTDRTALNQAAGYRAFPLDGVWVRGPYLHNGSVPTVRGLLEAPEHRPQTFYNQSDLIDTRNLGFVSSTAREQGRQLSLYEAAKRGNGNAGHRYGTDLSTSEKDALIEYLKTL